MKKEELEFEKKKEIKKGIITILLFFIFPRFYQLTIALFIPKMNNLILSFILLMGEILLTILLIFYQKNKFSNVWNDFKKNKKEYIDLMIKSWIIGFIIMVISNLIINIGFNNGIAENEALNRKIIKTLAIYAIPSVALFGPICEEITFRGSLKNIFHNKIIFIIISSIIFASAHLIGNISSIIDFLYLIPYGSLGAAMGYVYTKTDNILTNIFIHIFHNSISLLAIITLL